MALLPRWPVIQFVSDVVKGVEALGATIMVNGGLAALDDYALSMVWLRSVQESYPRLCRRSGQAVLLRLDATLTAPSPARLSSVRPWKAWPALAEDGRYPIVLSFSVQAEIDRTWSHLASDFWCCSHGGRRFGVGLPSYGRILAFAVWNSSSVIAPEAFNSASLASSSALSWGLDVSWT